MSVAYISCRLRNRYYRFLSSDIPVVTKEFVLIPAAGETLKFTGESGFGQAYFISGVTSCPFPPLSSDR